MNEKTKKLIELIKQQEEIEQQIKTLKEELIKELPLGYKEIYDNYELVKRSKKITITDEKTLAQHGILQRVKVTITKVDPALVKRIAEQEKLNLFKEIEEIVVFRNKD